MKKTLILLLVITALPCMAVFVWYSIPNITNYDLFDVEMRSTSYGWLCGDHSTIARYNGSNWTLSSVPCTYKVNGISATDDSNAWVVGDGGIILKYNGSGWDSFSSPTSQRLNDVWMIDSSHGCIIGNGVALMYNGTAWSISSPPGNYDWQAIWVQNSNNFWVSGSGGQVRHFQNGSWSSYNISGAGVLYGLWFNGSPDPNSSGWASDDTGHVYH